MRVIFFAWEKVYQWTNRLANRRVSFTEDEINYLIDIVDVWVEDHKSLDPEDDEVEAVYENMAIAIDVRDKLWRRLHG